MIEKQIFKKNGAKYNNNRNKNGMGSLFFFSLLTDLERQLLSSGQDGAWDLCSFPLPVIILSAGLFWPVSASPR